MNYYRGTVLHPYHLSVGAVLVNRDGEVACHHYPSLPEMGGVIGLDDVYILMRGTHECQDTLEETLKRELLEEFGATGKIETYLGALLSNVDRHGIPTEKVTLYFLVSLTSIDEAKREQDGLESQSIIEWHPIPYLSDRMRAQRVRAHWRTDIDESVILNRAELFLSATLIFPVTESVKDAGLISAGSL